MKTFYKWLENINTAVNLTDLKPQDKIGEGNFAKVYSTQNPNIVMRIEKQADPNSCEKFMSKPEIQATGGVAKIFDTNGPITYKERVNPNWSQVLAQKYKKNLEETYKNIPRLLSVMPYGEETANKFGETAAFIQLVLEKFRKKKDIIDFLNNFKEDAEGLIQSINMGLPFDDLHSGNLGINGQGKLVVIDC